MTPLQIRIARKLIGLTQHAMADAMGVTQGTITYWERGRQTPRERDVDAIRRMLIAIPRPAPPGRRAKQQEA